ncbi:hypothetical protein O6H91_18G064200 [Diphasiastrum complanatum]|uniref:Uncharacterized protein n=1 Tax=Diphasiastrum complanatum TaxID=34168 RepID=A0ACC2B354_DIPCM|nr:hypothetical protein O6H91_18G064200 [Diphasiastrum complanatum]
MNMELGCGGDGDALSSSSRGILCKSLINFLLKEHYLLTAYELLHELVENGHSEAAADLHTFFSDPDMFPSDQLLHLQSFQDVDCHQLISEKERATIMEYELRVVREELNNCKEKLEKKSKDFNVNASNDSSSRNDGMFFWSTTHGNLEQIGPHETRHLNCIVKEYLVNAGYKLTAMTFCEEVVDQDLNGWQDGAPETTNALYIYYQHYITTSSGGEKDKSTLPNADGSLLKKIECLEKEKLSLISALEAAEKLVKEYAMEISQLNKSLKQAVHQSDDYIAEFEAKRLQDVSSVGSGKDELPSGEESSCDTNEKIVPDNGRQLIAEEIPQKAEPVSLEAINPKTSDSFIAPQEMIKQEIVAEDIMMGTASKMKSSDIATQVGGLLCTSNFFPNNVEICNFCTTSKKAVSLVVLEMIQILAGALPKIVPYVLINHREELLPLIICAIEHHPEPIIRDSLTHTLFNLIKRPDQEQRRIIMDACVSLSNSVGELRVETELLPQCWEQINHKYEERRLLVAQSCGELGAFVKAEMRSSLILSIVEQLVEDPAAIVRDAASHNLALLVPLFPNMEKYNKVENLMFQLVCDPSDVVVKTSLQKLVPTVIAWAKDEKQHLTHLLGRVRSQSLAYAQHCSPMSGVEGSVEAALRVLGEKERWHIGNLLQMLTEVLPEIHSAIILSSPPLITGSNEISEHRGTQTLSDVLLISYLRGHISWPELDWITVLCLPAILQLSLMLSLREEALRMRLCKLLLIMGELFGSCFLNTFLVPVFYNAVGDDANLSYFQPELAEHFTRFKPTTTTGERLAYMCVMPLLLAGVLGANDAHKGALAQYLKDLVLETTIRFGSWTPSHSPELLEAIRFLCKFEQHHDAIVGVLWELVVNPNATVKVSVAVIFKELVAFVDIKLATQQVLPALVTLGTDANINVKYSTIEAFGAAARYFRDDLVADKIRLQMDAFLDDGSYEATIAVVRALTGAVPFMAPSLKDYLLQKLVVLSTNSTQGTTSVHRHEKADVFCNAVRALDATDLSQASARELLLPVIQQLLKDPDVLDPAHKEALEIILRERAGGRLDSISKVMGSHLGMSSVSNLFGENVFPSSRKDAGEQVEPSGLQPLQPEEGMLKRMMRTNFRLGT